MEGTLVANTPALRIQVLPLSALRPKAGTEDAEARLIRRAKERRPSAWVQIYDDHYRRLYLYCYARTADRKVAAKLASRVFLQAVQEIDHLVHWSGQPLFAWLYGMARKHVDEQLDWEHSCDHADAVTAKEDCQEMAWMRSLPREQQEVLALQYYAGCTTTEIAKVMERSEQFVEGLKARALRGLLHAGKQAPDSTLLTVPAFAGERKVRA
jgi:DNA-directed RNA polymerase specialized sigma24 family protein